MVMNTNIASNKRLSLFCKYGCQTPIKFDNSQISANGKKIPLNLDGTPHDCTSKRLAYNRRTIACKYCTQQITFDENVKADSGKMIPLNPDGAYHNCAKAPFNLSKNREKIS
jgi:hypothetical protein